eukprot:g18414.t1
MACFGRCAEMLCGEPCGNEVELNALRGRIRMLESEVDSHIICEPTIPSPNNFTKEQIASMMKQMNEDGELLVKQQIAESMDTLQNELENKQKEIDLLKEEKKKLSEGHVSIRELLSAHGEGAEEKILDLVNMRFDEEDANQEQRAFRQNWKGLVGITVLPNTAATETHLKEQYKARHQTLYKCPRRNKATFIDWQKDVYTWAKKLLEVGVTLEDLGERVITDGLEDFRHEQRRARKAGKNLVDIMLRLEEDSCPLTKNVVSECYRLIPQLERWDDMTPLAWVGILEDVFEKEAEVTKERDDESKWEYALQSLALDKNTTQHLRSTYRANKTNNFSKLSSRISALNYNDTHRYNADGTKRQRKLRKGKDSLEELYIALGEHSTHEALVTSSHEMNKTYSTVLGRAMLSSTATGAPPPLGNTTVPTPIDSDDLNGHSFFGGGNTGAPAPAGGPDGGRKWLTKEELKELNNTPCKFGKDCWNLKTKGLCLRKHTGAELKAGREHFEKNHPELAAKKKAEKEARDKKNKENKATAASASSADKP